MFWGRARPTFQTLREWVGRVFGGWGEWGRRQGGGVPPGAHAPLPPLHFNPPPPPHPPAPSSDQRLYRQSLEPGSAAVALTPADAKLRFADAVVDGGRGRLVAVCEDHSGKGEAVTTISAVGEQRCWGAQPCAHA